MGPKRAQSLEWGLTVCVFQVTKKDLYYYLSQFGSVEDCYLVKDYHTKKSKGLVLFEVNCEFEVKWMWQVWLCDVLQGRDCRPCFELTT